MTADRMLETEALDVVAYLNRAGLLQAMTGQAAVWRDALWGVRYPDAIEACRALARRPGVVQLKPGDLLFEVRKLRASRIGNRVPPAPPVELPAEVGARFGRVYLRALGDGASEAEADDVACRTVANVRRGALPPAEPGRLRELLAAATLDVPKGD